MSIFQAMGPCYFGGLLARDSGHRNGAPDFVTCHRRPHATGYHEGHQQPRQQSCKTPTHSRSFSPPYYCQLGSGRLWRDEVSARQNLGENKKADSRRQKFRRILTRGEAWFPCFTHRPPDSATNRPIRSSRCYPGRSRRSESFSYWRAGWPRPRRRAPASQRL